MQEGTSIALPAELAAHRANSEAFPKRGFLGWARSYATRSDARAR